jgi:hypothetical protein
MSRPRTANVSPRALACYALLSFGLAGFIWFGVDRSEGAPPRRSLEEARGVVTWWDSGRYSVRFELSGLDRGLSYASKFGALRRVGREIARAGQSPIRVLFQRTDREPPFWLDRSYDSVYEIEVGTRVIREWSEVDEAIRFDNSLTPWLAGAFLLSGAYLAHQWLKARDEAA